MNDRKQSVGSESSEKEALLAFPVIDELAADGAMHSLRSFPQIVNLQRRPILAETVREDAVGALCATEIDNLVSNRFDAADALDSHRIPSVILYALLDNPKMSSLINL